MISPLTKSYNFVVTVSRPSLPPSPQVTTATGIVAMHLTSSTGADKSVVGRKDNSFVVSSVFADHGAGLALSPLELPACEAREGSEGPEQSEAQYLFVL